MRDISFFSDSVYLHIPNAKAPKVILAVDNGYIAKNAFKLYNPFSSKAKLFKRVLGFIAVYLRFFLKKITKLETYKSSEFIHFLNEKYQKKFTSSIYYATLKDKVVIQLQENNKVFGYVKFPINKVGLSNLKNEIKAIKILSEKNIIGYHADVFEYERTPFFVLPELEGDIKDLEDDDAKNLLKRYYKGDFYELKNHPRVKEIESFFKENKQEKHAAIIEDLKNSSTKKYADVFEHGDFAPWNIVRTENGYSAFDFEYFVEHGIEYFDLIKYHFQIGRLLKAIEKENLYFYIQEKIHSNEFREIFILFLIKEIMVHMQLNTSYSFYEDLLNIIYND